MWWCNFKKPAASSPTLKMDTAGTPAKHFQQSTKLHRVTSQRTSLETTSMFHTTIPKLQCLKIKRPNHTFCLNSCPDSNVEQPVSCRLPIHLCTVGHFRYTVCIVRPLQLIVINISHSCSDLYSWLLTYTVCTFRSVQLLVIDTLYACSDTYSQLLWKYQS